MSTAARRIGLGTVFVCLAATLTLSLAQKSPCMEGDWADGRQYTRLCYTDVVPLLGAQQLAGGRLPYLDACDAAAPGECDEYPVLSMWTMRVAAWASDSAVRTFFLSNVVILTIAAFVVALGLYLMVGGRALYFALAPTLLAYAFVNWDLLAVAFATASTVMYLRRRDVASGVLLGLGAAAKIYPALLLVPFVAGRLRSREPDRAVHLAWAAAGSWIVVNLPFAIGGTTGWWEFFRFNSERPADWDSLWFIACHRLSGEIGSCGNTRV
ncbi:MAG: glycosyltransferase 87 family protein, partial [Actinomycetota bacterium]